MPNKKHTETTNALHKTGAILQLVLTLFVETRNEVALPTLKLIIELKRNTLHQSFSSETTTKSAKVSLYFTFLLIHKSVNNEKKSHQIFWDLFITH